MRHRGCIVTVNANFKAMDVAITLGVLMLAAGGARAQQCRFPGAPAHCHVTFTDPAPAAATSGETAGADTAALGAGAVATYECERGFELLGPSRRVCDGGRWLPEGIPFCVLNVAAGKAPMQISTEGGGAPQRALDGSTAPAFSPETCSLTKPERVPWWYVNLLEPYMVQLVRLDFGKPCCGSKPAVVVVRVGNNRPDLGTNPVCNRFTGRIEEGQPLFLPCNPPMPGAFVSVHLEAASPSQLSLCEAFVYTDQALPIERCPQFRDQPPGGTATYNGKCYIFYSGQPATFRDALAFCRARGGSLVDESNPALQGFISWELWRRHRSDSSSQYWLGAVRDPRDSANWRWVSGGDVAVSFWSAPGGGGGCARLDGGKGWLWADTDCQAQLNYICQHQPRACGRPEQPPNSTMAADSTAVGASVQYSCDAGHLLVGPAVRTCRDTGFYDEFPPVCKRIECGLPAQIAHGSYELVNGSVGYMAHVQYACHGGYEMAGRARLVCDIDERWNGPPPRCDIISCEELQPPSNGRIILSHNASVFGSVAEVACARGFRLTGARRLACLPSGHWDKPAPRCIPEERPTSAPATPTTTTATAAAASTTTAQPTTPTTVEPSTQPPSSTPRLVLAPRRPPPRPSSPAPFTRRPAAKQPPERKADAHESPTSHVPHIIVASHPRENQIIGSSNSVRAEPTPRVTAGGPREPLAARLSLGAVVALGAFGALVFLSAILTTIVILVRRKQHDGKRYRHHVSGDCGTVASLDSSSSESRSGLTRYYRQAWEELHEAAGAGGRGARRDREAPKDGSELVVADACAPRDRRRRHHHHRRDWHAPHAHHHKPRY